MRKLDKLRKVYEMQVLNQFLAATCCESLVCECCSRTDRRWCGALLGLKMYKLWQKHSWRTTFRSTLAPHTWLLTTTSCRS